jgi:hypothetical protein
MSMSSSSNNPPYYKCGNKDHDMMHTSTFNFNKDLSFRNIYLYYALFPITKYIAVGMDVKAISPLHTCKRDLTKFFHSIGKMPNA